MAQGAIHWPTRSPRRGSRSRSLNSGQRTSPRGRSSSSSRSKSSHGSTWPGWSAHFSSRWIAARRHSSFVAALHGDEHCATAAAVAQRWAHCARGVPSCSVRSRWRSGRRGTRRCRRPSAPSFTAFHRPFHRLSPPAAPNRSSTLSNLPTWHLFGWASGSAACSSSAQAPLRSTTWAGCLGRSCMSVCPHHPPLQISRPMQNTPRLVS